MENSKIPYKELKKYKMKFTQKIEQHIRVTLVPNYFKTTIRINHDDYVSDVDRFNFPDNNSRLVVNYLNDNGNIIFSIKYFIFTLDLFEKVETVLLTKRSYDLEKSLENITKKMVEYNLKNIFAK
jgi:hypothetical protein